MNTSSLTETTNTVIKQEGSDDLQSSPTQHKSIRSSKSSLDAELAAVTLGVSLSDEGGDQLYVSAGERLKRASEDAASVCSAASEDNNSSSAEPSETSAKEGTGERPRRDHPLTSVWSMWWEKRPDQLQGQSKAEQSAKEYRERMLKLGSFRTVENFYRVFERLKEPSTVDVGVCFHCFRGKKAPCWERYPKGGCWTAKSNTEAGFGGNIDQVWKTILFELVSEQFDDTRIQGIVLRRKYNTFALSLWHSEADYDARLEFGARMRQRLGLEDDAKLLYTDFEVASKQKSTFRGAQEFVCRSDSPVPIPTTPSHRSRTSTRSTTPRAQHHHGRRGGARSATPRPTSPRNRAPTPESRPRSAFIHITRSNSASRGMGSASPNWRAHDKAEGSFAGAKGPRRIMLGASQVRSSPELVRVQPLRPTPLRSQLGMSSDSAGTSS